MQANNQYDQAIGAFKQLSAINKSEWGAEARYETANCYFTLNQLSTAEKAAMEVIKVTGLMIMGSQSIHFVRRYLSERKGLFQCKSNLQKCG